jgi:thiol peroxidase
LAGKETRTITKACKKESAIIMSNWTFHGESLHSIGHLPEVGALVPDFVLVDNLLQDVSLQTFSGKKKVLVIVPSIDAPVCAASARQFDHRAGRLPEVAVLLISADLPFAQCRFCETEKLTHLIALSCFRSEFSYAYGVKLNDGVLRGLTARAVLVINENNQLIYAEWVEELTHEPNYQAAFEAISAC